MHRDVRATWEQLRERVDREAREQKMSQAAILELSRQYRLVRVGERKEVDELVAEWVLSDDENKRFDALALISEHRIKSATPALHRLAERLKTAADPSAPYELAKVNRILGKLKRCSSVDRDGIP
jgi:uncharacterized protein HemX